MDMSFRPLKMREVSDSKAKPIVFVHIPKTAGTSFRLAAEERIGRNFISKDYGPSSGHTSKLVKKYVYGRIVTLDELMDEMLAEECRFFTGHFHVSKYLAAFGDRVRWCTFIRHPVRRVISEFLHMSSEGTYTKPLNSFIDEPSQCNRQTKLLSGIDIPDFFFVGVTEMYEDSIELFNRISGLDFPVLNLNVGKRRADDAGLNEEMIQQIERNNRHDLELHRLATELLRKRLENL